MINFPRIHMKKIMTAGGLLDPSSSSSSLSSRGEPSRGVASSSSFHKPRWSPKTKNQEDRSSTLSLTISCPSPTATDRSTTSSGDSTRNKRRDKSTSTSTNNVFTETATATATATTKKAVRFHKNAKVKRVRMRHQYSVQEQEALWYTENEYTEIKGRVIETVKLMMQHDATTKEQQKQKKDQKHGNTTGDNDDKLSSFSSSIEEDALVSKLSSIELLLDNDDNDDNGGYTSRGLECRTKHAARQRKEFKLYARELVLEEQQNQINDYTGGIDPNRLRHVYLDASIVALTKAQMFGRMDAEQQQQQQ